MPTDIPVELCTEATPDALRDCIDRVIASGARSLLVLASDGDGWTREAVDPVLREVPVPLMGGIFPNIIHGGTWLYEGTLIVGLQAPFELAVVRDLSSGTDDLDERIRSACASDGPTNGLVIVVDGLTRNIERYLESVYNLVGTAPSVIGGGAGSLDFVQKPCLFTNDGLIADAALLARLPFTLHRGVNHGWEILKGPFLATRSHTNVLETLNYTPAFDIYRELVESESALRFAEHDFFSIAKTYPLGIECLDSDILVRDPIRVENDALVCVGEVPENSMIYLLKGDGATLAESAGAAAAQARESSAGTGAGVPPSVVIFDCVSRVLFLDKEFDCEMRAINDGLGEHANVFGALTLGEITNTRSGPISLLNKSTVIGTF
jgi:hypothetical protein